MSHSQPVAYKSDALTITLSSHPCAGFRRKWQNIVLKNSFYLDQVNTESVNNNANNKHRPNNKVVTYTNLNQPYNSNTADAMHRMSPGAVDPRKTDADTSVAAAAAAVAVFSGSE